MVSGGGGCSCLSRPVSLSSLSNAGGLSKLPPTTFKSSYFLSTKWMRPTDVVGYSGSRYLSHAHSVPFPPEEVVPHVSLVLRPLVPG